MSKRSEELARRFEEANAGLSALVAGLSDAQWGAPSDEEGRTVGVVAAHVAASYLSTLGFMQLVASGQPIPAVSWEMIHAMNADNDAKLAGAGRDETLALLRANGATVADAMRAMTDAELDCTATVALISPEPISAAHVGEFLVLGHIRAHAPGIQHAARQA